MSKRKANDYISSTFMGIIKESREQKAYDLGMANGIFNLYIYILNETNEEEAKKFFKYFLVGSENINTYFREMVKLYEEENTVVDDILDKFKM